MYLETAAKIIGEHEINLTEEGMLDLLQIKYRWPEMAIEVINQCGNTSNGFFDSRKFLIYDRWKRLYDLVEYEKYNSLDEKIYNFSTEGHE